MNQCVENVLDNGEKRILVDLLFDLAAGDSVIVNGSYEDQLEYFIPLILPNHASVEEFAEYGQKYRMSSKYMFPGRPEKVKNRGLLVKLFSSFVVIKEIADSESYDRISDFVRMKEYILSSFDFLNEADRSTFSKEVMYLTKRYTEMLSKNDYNTFLNIFNCISKEFDETYSKILDFVLGNISTFKKGELSHVLEQYNIDISETTRFHLVLDAIAETVVIKNQCLEYEDEFKKEWENRFYKFKYDDVLWEYVQSKKSAFVVSYGNNIRFLRNENFLFKMLADVTVKLALVDGAKNLQDLTEKIKILTHELGDNIKEVFIDCRKTTIRTYHLAQRGDYSSDLGNALIPYRSDLMYLRDIIIEEISIRNSSNIVQKKSRKTMDASEYELSLSQKDEEIYDLKRELEYYENIKQQEFKAEVLQYNRALTDLFRKMCDFKYNSPLNELYLFANGLKELTQENIKGIIQNLIFIMSTMNIVPYETGNVGKKIKFYDDEANIVYAVDDSKVKEGLNKGSQIYPGWKYKDAELVLPKVDIEED